MKLTELYKLRHSFTVIGLTGRKGSGCSEVAEILSGNVEDLLKGVRNHGQIGNQLLAREVEICRQYLSYSGNWHPFEVIKYKDVLLFYMIMCIGTEREKLENILYNYYTEAAGERNKVVSQKVTDEIFEYLNNPRYTSVLVRIHKFHDIIHKIKTKKDLKELNDVFFGPEFKDISLNIFSILENNGYIRRTRLLHFISCNIRSSKDPLNLEEKSEINNIYTIAGVINRLIKARKTVNDDNNKPTKIIIDSLRNSLEIMFFKERYSAFYMFAIKEGSNRNKERVKSRLPKALENDQKDKITNRLLEIDANEYQTNDYSKGVFASPDVYNCIQKSEIHLVNYTNEDGKNESGFYSIQEQLLKIISLIHQPGIITPSASERCMQIAYNAKLNSGCISRQVGAVVTDRSYAIKAVGWNDVPQGQTPCNLRNVNDYFENNLSEQHYSNFERGVKIDNIDIDYKYKNSGPKVFPQAVKDYFQDTDPSVVNENLEGKNCSFCFKSIHNFYEGEKNQVHTKSLHAEENAMLQISKYGGQGLKDGILFTTASPCELCSKKAVQLGISKVYFIDPYPGISEPQILTNTRKDKMELVSFYGAVSKAYNKLYEPFMAYKDEVAIMLENSPKDYKTKSGLKEIISLLSNEELKKKLDAFISEDSTIDEEQLLAQLSKL